VSEHPNAATVRGRALARHRAGALIELSERSWTVVRAQPLDQAAFDAFWA